MLNNFATTASCCCLLLGGASLRVDTAHSFLAPNPTTATLNTRIMAPSSPHRRPHRDITRIIWSPLEAGGGARDDASASDSSPKTFVDELSAISLEEGERKIIMDEDGDSSDSTTKYVLIGGTVAVLLAAGALAVTMGNELGIDMELGQLIKDPSASFDTILKSLETMDPQKGIVYFSSFYVLAEILAIPAVPLLTASSGYLFGTLPGTAACLVSAGIAASVSFVIGRTLLRGYVEKVLDKNPKFGCMDRAIEKEGFKLMLLLRLSPLFPFALSNYLYGASSIRFLPYFFGTVLGFAPGTLAYVYAGRVGKALTIDSASSEPWYVYAGGMAVLVALIKIAGDVASGVIDAMEEEQECEV